MMAHAYHSDVARRVTGNEAKLNLRKLNILLNPKQRDEVLIVIDEIKDKFNKLHQLSMTFF